MMAESKPAYAIYTAELLEDMTGPAFKALLRQWMDPLRQQIVIGSPDALEEILKQALRIRAWLETVDGIAKCKRCLGDGCISCYQVGWVRLPGTKSEEHSCEKHGWYSEGLAPCPNCIIEKAELWEKER